MGCRETAKNLLVLDRACRLLGPELEAAVRTRVIRALLCSTLLRAALRCAALLCFSLLALLALGRLRDVSVPRLLFLSRPMRSPGRSLLGQP